MGLLHYLSGETYEKIYHILGLKDEGNNINGCISYPDNRIFYINLFNIVYKQFGHIWFMDVYINFPKFQCEYFDFEKKLFKQYKELFGKNVMNDFPVLDQIVCNYVEYFHKFKISNVDEIEKKAKDLGCPPVKLNLNINEMANKTKVHNKFHLCVSKNDARHIDMLAFGYGSALKQRIKDKSFHGPVGIKTSKIVNQQTEKEIVNWVLKRNNFEFNLQEEYE
jgi:hypothetical protein